MSENLRRVHEAGIPIATGTDAGNPLTLHGPSIYHEVEAMEAAGIAPDEVIVMSTRNGAEMMGRLDDLGTLEKGKLADLVVLNEDPGASVSAFRSITYGEDKSSSVTLSILRDFFNRILWRIDFIPSTGFDNPSY